MNIDRVRFLREVLVTDAKGKTTLVMEFSYDDRFEYRHRFFGVPDDQEMIARRLYEEWGGSRLEGYWRGTTVGRPETVQPG
jgi:hypothetical protein